MDNKPKYTEAEIKAALYEILSRLSIFMRMNTLKEVVDLVINRLEINHIETKKKNPDMHCKECGKELPPAVKEDCGGAYPNEYYELVTYCPCGEVYIER